MSTRLATTVRKTVAQITSRQRQRLLLGQRTTRALTQFMFRTGVAPSAANCLGLRDLVPDKDPLRHHFEKLWIKEPESLAEAQDWIDRNWNIAAESRIVIDEEDRWLSGLSSALAPVFDHWVNALR